MAVTRIAYGVLMLTPLHDALTDLYARLKPLTDGDVATYIPELGRADPDLFAICITTVDGHQYRIGDAGAAFTIQSISKPFVYGLALGDRGVDEVMQRVGVEPSGEAFNAISLEPDSGRPRNPMINAGAIATTALVNGAGPGERLERIVEVLSQLAGRSLSIDDAVYLSEQATGHRNRAIAHLLRNAAILGEDVEGALDCYFKQCSVLVNCADLSAMAATLANGGTNPQTGRLVVAPEHVGNVLSVMSTCGMYDYAGSWLYRVGMPAKSGVSGGILAVLPGQLGIGVFSPRLDAFGNSVRGVAVCEAFSREFGLHLLRPPVSPGAVVLGSYSLAELRSQRRRNREEARVLEKQGERVRILKLQGPLVMSTAEVALRRASEDAANADVVILDFQRVHSVDGAARKLFERFTRDRSRTVALSGLREDFWPPPVPEPGGGPDAQSGCYFGSLDDALEWCEDGVLRGAGIVHKRDDAVAPHDHPLLSTLSDAEMQALAPLLRRAEYAAGARIITQGGAPDVAFLLAAGTVNVVLQLAGGRAHRIATIGAGATFGELALMDDDPRTAHVEAATDVVCYGLRVAELAALPGGAAVRAKLIEQLAREMTARLRRADAEIAALAL